MQGFSIILHLQLRNPILALLVTDYVCKQWFSIKAETLLALNVEEDINKEYGESLEDERGKERYFVKPVRGS